MLLHVEALALVGLTIVLAGPVTAGLARAQWTARAPRAALVLWQAVGWSGGLGILSAGLTLAAGSMHDHWREGIAALPDRWPHLGVWAWVGMTITLGLGAWLIAVAVASAARVTSARRAHRRRLDLISEVLEVGQDGTDTAGWDVRVLDHSHALAYCVPGLRPRVVLTRGALEALSPGQLRAVLAHELSHARGYHDLVIQPFVAWARTFPFLRSARNAVGAVGLLVEMVADDAALRSGAGVDLRSALRVLTGQHIAVAGTGPERWRGDLDARAMRLGGSAEEPLSIPLKTVLYLAALALVCVPPIVLLVS